MEPIIKIFSKWGTTHDGLFTFAQSQKHLGLYQRFGFWPRFLTAIMSLPVNPNGQQPLSLFSGLSGNERQETLIACADLTNEIYPA